MKPGRVSAASLAVVPCIDGELIRRPRPLPELNAEQAVEWRVVVDALPADWFRPETFGLLAQYCRHRVAARRVAALIASAESDDGELDIGNYDRLLKMQEREGRAISSLATKMRISQQTTFDKSKKKGTLQAKPWEMKADEKG